MKSEMKVIKQADLSAECWPVQIWGLEECESCLYRDTEGCGGAKVRATGMNEKGFKVPLESQEEGE